MLPKAIVTATAPVAQVMLPLAMHLQGRNLSIRAPIAKAIAMTFALGALGAAFLWAAAGRVCNGGYGVRFCDVPTLVLLAGAAIPMAVIRTATIGQVLGGRRSAASCSPGRLRSRSAAAFGLGWLGGLSLALSYALISWIVLALIAATPLLMRSPAASRPAPAQAGGD